MCLKAVLAALHVVPPVTHAASFVEDGSVGTQEAVAHAEIRNSCAHVPHLN